MPNPRKATKTLSCVQGEIRLAGALDSRMINLLRAIDEYGSINQAAKQVGLSYKGAWQMVERANNFSPKVLISTATGGSKGGGTSLTTAGRALLELFTQLDQQHQEFLHQLNQNLEADSEMLLLLKPLTIKTSATNQLFATIIEIQIGEINALLFAALKGGEKIAVSMPISELEALNLVIGSGVLLLINSSEISVLTDLDNSRLAARNCLSGHVIRTVQDGVDSEIVVSLPGKDSLTATITQVSAVDLALMVGNPVYVVFKSNAVVLAVAENL